MPYLERGQAKLNVHTHLDNQFIFCTVHANSNDVIHAEERNQDKCRLGELAKGSKVKSIQT